MRKGIKYDSDFDRYYFPREDDYSTGFKKKWFNIRTGKISHRARITAKYYEYGKDEFWRHTAANIKLIQIGENWYLRITPKYFFTTNGTTPWDTEKVGPYTTEIKALEKNPHVLNQILFWSNAILGVEKKCETIQIWLDYKIKSETKPIMIVETMPVTGISNFSIPFDPATYEEPHIDKQMNLDFLKQFEDYYEDE